MSKPILISLIYLLLASCTKIAVYQSINETDYNKETIYSGYNSESGLRWLISNDYENLYIRFDTDNNQTMLKFVSTGIKIYIDTLLKQKRGMYLNYPIFQTNEFQKNKIKQQHNNFENNIQYKKQNTEMLLQKTPHDIYFFKNNKLSIYISGDKNNDIKANLFTDNMGNMQYFAQIPLNQIKSNGLTNINELLLCIHSEGFDIEANTHRNSEESTIDLTNNNRNSNRNMGKSRHQREEDGYSQTNYELTKPIEIWFKINLSK